MAGADTSRAIAELRTNLSLLYRAKAAMLNKASRLGSNCLSKGSHRVQKVALLLQTGDIFIFPRTRSRYIGICISTVAARAPEHD